jgi:hypothetical protein
MFHRTSHYSDCFYRQTAVTFLEVHISRIG